MLVFPKKVMTIRELIDLDYGFTKDELLKYAHCDVKPARLTPGGGKWKFDTDKLNDAMGKYGYNNQ